MMKKKVEQWFSVLVVGSAGTQLGRGLRGFPEVVKMFSVLQKCGLHEFIYLSE